MNPLKNLCFAFFLIALLVANVAAQTVYFYPPDDAKWIASRSYISQGTAATSVALSIDSTTCGWYKATIPASSPLRNYAQFWLGKSGKDRIGSNGRWATDFDLSDDFNVVGGVFNLGNLFAKLGNNIYFVADELDPADPDAGWYSLRPFGYDDASRCKFELAAFIYDTDPSVHPDFSCGSYGDEDHCSETPVNSNKKATCTGVIKGLVKPNLNPSTRKIEYSGTDPKQCWTSTDWFNKAFAPTTGVNVQRCYNMPFSQVRSGSSAGNFEFDSDKLLNANGKLVGGFFPEILDSRGTDNYSGCPTCDTKRAADGFVPKVTALTKEKFDAYESKEGDFKDGDTPTRGAFGLTPASETIYDWSARETASWYLHGTTAIKNTYGALSTGYAAAAKANQHFCFESHAEFVYDPSQVFYFSGDDDIWVYINNKLVIDLGGAHLAAPSHINLNTLGLMEGELYPIDIFYCDKRTTQSNLRISTNIYVAQKSNFYNDLDRVTNPMCVLYQGGADCASKMGMGGNSMGNLCGPQLISGGFKVDFYMVRRGTTDTTYLSKPPSGSQAQRGDCVDTGTNAFTCYKGIVVREAVYTCGGRGQCKGNAEATSKVDVVGSFNLYARLVGLDGKPSAKPLLIDNFKSETNMRIVWGHLESEDGRTKLDLKNANGAVATKTQIIAVGKRTPIYIASGLWLDESTFLYDNDPEVAGREYAVRVSSPTGGTLRIFKTETDPTPVTSGKLPASGIDTLWVEGTAEGEYFLNLSGVVANEAAPSMRLTVSQSALKITIHSPASNIKAKANGNSILLENLPANAKIELYNLQGRRIYSSNSENSQILKILVQTKGMYIIKIGSNNIMRVPVM